MKIRIVGGPATGKVEVETDPSANFATIMVLAEGAVGKGSLHDKFTFYRCEIVNSKARAIAALAPTESPQSVGLPASGSILMLKAKDGSPASTPRENATGSSTPSVTPRPQGTSFRDRMIAIYQKYEPAKQGTVDATLDKYKGKEEAVIAKLVEKYGPEPVAVEAKAVPGAPEAAVSGATPRDGTARKSIRDRVMAMYEKYQPAKVGTVDATLLKFKGKEEQVLKKLVDMYGPEPVDAVSSPSAPSDAPHPKPLPQQKKTPRERMVAIYEKYEPSKVGSVDATLQKFAGKEEAVIKKLVEKYGPEPTEPNPTAAPHQPAAVPPPPPPAPAAPPPPPPPAPTHAPKAPASSASKAPTAAPAPPPPAPSPPPASQEPASQPAPQPASHPSSPTTYRERMIAIYTAYEPSKLSTVDANLEKYKGKEEAVIKKLVEKYGPEPSRPASGAAADDREMSDQESPRARGASVARSRAVSVAPAQSSAPDGGDQARAEDKVAEAPQPAEASHQPPNETEGAAEPAAAVEPQPETPNEHATPVTPAENVAPATPTTSKDEEGPLSPASEQHSVSRAPDPRFTSLVAAALRRAWDEANHHTLRMRWHIWVRHTLEQKAEKLVAQGKWTVDPKNGEFECTEANPPYKTADLVAFLQLKQGTSRSQVLSDTMCDILRVVVRKSAVLIDPATPPAIPVMFHDDDHTAGLLNTLTIVALDDAKECQNQFHQLQSDHSATCAELTLLRTAHADASQRLGVAEPAVAKLATLQGSHSEALRELDALRKKCSKQEDDIKQLSSELTRTQKELEMERRGLPTNMEVMLRQKDARLATLEQELTKLRLKVRHQHSSEMQNASRIRELEADVNLLERSRSVVAISRKGQLGHGSPMSGAATQRSPNRKTISRSPDLSLPKTFSQSLRESPRGFSSMASSARNQRTERSPPQVPPIAASLIGIRPADDSTDEALSYEPSARPSHHAADAAPSSPQTARELRELAVRSEILEQELLRTPRVTEQMGNCPHCQTALTALKGSPVQSKQGGNGASLVAKRGFCFSCRRSFTAQDLAEYASASKIRRERSRV